MAKLVVSMENDIRGHYFLDKDTFVIGRNEDSDIHLDDPSVSKLHANIITIENDQILEDKGSINGIKVNGKTVVRHILQNNDVIDIGNFQLKYINQRASSNMDFDKTMLLDSTPNLFAEIPENDSVPENGEITTAPLAKKKISVGRELKTNFPLGGLRCVKGENAGQEVLVSRPLKTFGQAGSQVVMLCRRPFGYYVTLVEGKKSPRINGTALGAEEHPLKEGDTLEIAGQQWVFFLRA